MTKQTELFPLEDYTDREYTPPADWEVTSRSTRRKTPPKRKTIALLQSNDRLSNIPNH